MSSRSQQALALYRRILRAGRTWGGPEDEKRYIFEETRKSFRKNQSISSADEVDKLIRDGETRLEYGVHYSIPYPRLHHASQFRQRYFMEASHEEASGAAPHSGDSESDAKLAAAMARRKAKMQRNVPQ